MSNLSDCASPDYDIRKRGLARLGPLEKILFVMIACPLWLSIGWLLVVSLPRAEQLLFNFQMKVPYLSDFVRDWGRVAFPAVLLYACILGVMSQRRWAVYLSFIVLPAILSILIFVSIYMPTRALNEGLGGNQDDLWFIFWG